MFVPRAALVDYALIYVGLRLGAKCLQFGASDLADHRE